MKIHESAYKFMLTFGKYKGRSLGHVLEVDRQYVEWLSSQKGLPKETVQAAKDVLVGKSITNIPLSAKLPQIQVKIFVANSKKGVVGCTFGYNEEVADRLRNLIDGVTWNKKEKRWEFNKVHLIRAIEFFKPMNPNISDEIKKWAVEIHKQKQLLLTLREKLDSDLVVKGNIELYGYQRSAIEFGLATGGRFLLADHPGLGKTLTSLGFTTVVGGKTLIVCPKSVKLQWEKEIKRFTGKNACIWDGQGYIGSKLAHYHIINYDNVHKHFQTFKEMKFDTLICDEATKVKNYKSIRYKTLFGNWSERRKYPGLKTKYLIHLTGTPLMNRPMELYTLLSTIDKNRFKSPFHFMQRYTSSDGKGGVNLLELNERVKEIMIRRLKSEVAKQLKKSRSNIWLELETSEFKEYQKTLKQVLSKWSQTGIPSAADMPRLRNILFEYKFPRVIEFCEEMIDSGRSVLVFTIQQAHAERIVAHFGDNARLITGKVSQKDRDKAIQDVKDGKAQVMVMTIIAGGMGIDGLQHVISDALFVDRWFVPGDHEQAEDRINRIGQTQPTQMWYLTVANTYDEHMAELLTEKQRIIDLAVDGKLSEDDTKVIKARKKSMFGDLVKKMISSSFKKIDEEVMLDE